MAKSKAKKFGHRYPWGEWFALGTVQLRKGRDYTGMTHGMAAMARNAASRLGLRLHVVIDQDMRGLSLEVTGSLWEMPYAEARCQGILFGD